MKNKKKYLSISLGVGRMFLNTLNRKVVKHKKIDEQTNMKQEL